MQQASRVRKHSRQNRGAIHADSVNNPLIPPSRKCGGQARDPSCAIHRYIDYARIEPGGRLTQAHRAEPHSSNLAAASESVILAFLHVILVIDRVRKWRNLLSIRSG